MNFYGFVEIQNDAIEKVSDGAEITKAFEFLSEEERKSESEYLLLLSSNE